MEEPADETICITRFLQEFEHAIGEDVQLRGGIVGSYSLPPEDVEGEVTDWALQYLEQRKCPYTLAVSLAKTVAQQLSTSVHQRVLQSNGSSKEDGTKRFLDSSQLHMETINNLLELCSQWKDRPEIANDKINWMGYEIRHVTSVCAIKNGRRKMEDRHLVLHDLNTFCGFEDAPHHSYYAVFDGHAGVDAASFATAHLHKNIVNHSAFLTDTETAIKVAFQLTDEQFLDRSSREGIKSGCTVVCALIREQTLYLAWLGDSQAILVRNGSLMTIMSPHKPDRQDERKRIEDLNGYVLFNNGTWRVSGTLAVSRALGDPEYKPFVSSEPDVSTIPFDGSEDFLILACDGLWDRLSPSDAAIGVYQHLANSPDDVENVSARLVHQAKELGSSDNITAIVVFLRDLPSLIASAPNYSLLFPQLQDLQAENRTHMINGDNHLIECNRDESTEKAVEKPNMLDLTSGFMPHCPQTDYNISNPFSDFLQHGENGPEGLFQYQAISKGIAPEATALSELPTPPIDEIIAAQQFEMASSDNNPFHTQQILLSTSELQSASHNLPEHVGEGVDPSEAKVLAAEIVNQSIEAAVRQVSSTPPPPDYASQEEEQQQDDSGLEEGPLEDSELSPEYSAEGQTQGLAGSCLSPYAEPFYPASLRTQAQSFTSDLQDVPKSIPLESESTEKSALHEDDLLSEPSTSDICLEQNEALEESLISLLPDSSQMTSSNAQIVAELANLTSVAEIEQEVAVGDVQFGLGSVSDGLICFDQAFPQQTEERNFLGEPPLSMASIPAHAFETETKEEEAELPHTQLISDTSGELFGESTPFDSILPSVEPGTMPQDIGETTKTVSGLDLVNVESLKGAEAENLFEDENYNVELYPSKSPEDHDLLDVLEPPEYTAASAPEISGEIDFSASFNTLQNPEVSALHSENVVEEKIHLLPEDLIDTPEEIQQKTEDTVALKASDISSLINIVPEIPAENIIQPAVASEITLQENIPQATVTPEPDPLQDISQSPVMSELTPAENILQPATMLETTSAEVTLQPATMLETTSAEVTLQPATMLETTSAEVTLQPSLLPETTLAETILQAPLTQEVPTDFQEFIEISKEESSCLQPIATSSPIAPENQTANLHEPASGDDGLYSVSTKEPLLLTDSASLVQKDETPSSLGQFVEPLSAPGAFLPAIQATLLEVTGTSVPSDSLVDDIPQGATAVIEGIPDNVPEAEGVTEDVDSDSEKDGGWSYIKVNASQEPPAAEKTTETLKSTTVIPPDEKAKKQPVKVSTTKTLKKDVGKPLDAKLKCKPGPTAVKAKSTSASLADAKDKISSTKATGGKPLPKRQPLTTASARKSTSQPHPTAAKTATGPPPGAKYPATPKLPSAQPSTITKSSRVSVGKEQKPPDAGPTATKSLPHKSVPPSTTSTTSRLRPSITGTRPASAPGSRPKDVSSSHTVSTKPGSSVTKLNSTEAVRKAPPKPLISTLKQTPPKQPTSSSTVQKLKDTKNAPRLAQNSKEGKTAPNTVQVPSSGAVRKSVPKIDTKQTKDNVNKQISAKTPQPKEKSSSTSVSERTLSKKPESIAKQSLTLGKTETKSTIRRPTSGTTAKVSSAKTTTIQGKDLKSKQPLKRNQTVQSKPKCISEEPKKDSQDLQTPEQEKGSLEANNRETVVGDSSGATPETPISSSVTSSVSEEQPAMKADDEKIHLDAAATTNI